MTFNLPQASNYLDKHGEINPSVTPADEVIFDISSTLEKNNVKLAPMPLSSEAYIVGKRQK